MEVSAFAVRVEIHFEEHRLTRDPPRLHQTRGGTRSTHAESLQVAATFVVSASFNGVW